MAQETAKNARNGPDTENALFIDCADFNQHTADHAEGSLFEAASLRPHRLVPDTWARKLH